MISQRQSETLSASSKRLRITSLAYQRVKNTFLIPWKAVVSAKSRSSSSLLWWLEKARFHQTWPVYFSIKDAHHSTRLLRPTAPLHHSSIPASIIILGIARCLQWQTQGLKGALKTWSTYQVAIVWSTLNSRLRPVPTSHPRKEAWWWRTQRRAKKTWRSARLRRSRSRQRTVATENT